MRLLPLMLLITVITTTSAAQSSAGDQVPPNLRIEGFGYSYPDRFSGRFKDHPSDRPIDSSPDSDDNGPWSFERLAKVFIFLRNTGPKPVKAIEWEFVFFNPVDQKVLEQVKFRTVKTILPGQRVTLQSRFMGKLDGKWLRDLEKRCKAKTKLLFRRIEYSDGSTWQRP